MAKRRTRLFRYQHSAGASRTLRALRAAWPETSFDVVPESLGFGFNILAALPNGSVGLVAKMPLRSFGSGARA